MIKNRLSSQPTTQALQKSQITYSGANPFIISICGTTVVSGINIRDSATNNFITNKFIMCLYWTKSSNHYGKQTIHIWGSNIGRQLYRQRKGDSPIALKFYTWG